jgi:type I restriction enzyme S subunit
VSRWPLAPLGELGAEVRNACVGGPFGSELTTKDYVEAGIPVIRGSNLGEDGFIDSGFVFVTEAKAEALHQNQARPGDIVFTQRGTIGQVAIVPSGSRFDRYLISQSQMKLTPDLRRVEPRFLVHYFKSPSVLHLLRNSTLATGVPHINLTILRRVPVPVPPVSEQRRIANILDKADAIRRRRREAINLTEALLRSAFLETFGDPVTNPKGWPVTTLGDEAGEMKYGTSEKCGPAFEGASPVLRIPNVARGDIDWSDLKFAALSPQEVAALRLRGGDLLFVRSNGNPDYIGRCAVYDSEREALFASYLIRVRLRPRRLEPIYVRAALSSESYRARLTAEARTTAGNYNISTEGLRRLRLPAPPSELQKRFGELSLAVRRSRGRLAVAAQFGHELFSSLVQRVFSEDGRLSC